jgi:putative MFS transporter
MATNTGSTGTITFDELFAKLDNSRLTANHYKLITAAVLGDLLEFFDLFLISFVLAFIVVPWKLSFGATAVVLLSAGVGSFLGSFFFGWLADRWGRLTVCIIAIFTFSVPTGLLYFTPNGNWILLSALRFVVGFGVGGLYSVDLPLVQEFVPSRYRGAIGGLVTALIPTGTMLASISAAYLTPMVGWRGLFLIGLIPCAMSLMFRLWMRESPRYLISRGRYQDAIKSINWVLRENYDPKNVVISATTSQLKKAAPKFSEIFQYPRSVAVAWTTNFLQAIFDYGFVLWCPTLFVLTLNVSAARAAEMFIVVSFFSVFGKPLWAFISEAIGRRLAGMIMAVGAAITQLIFANFWQYSVGGLPVIWLSAMAVYFFVNGGFAITGPYSSEIWPQRLRGTGMGSSRCLPAPAPWLRPRQQRRQSDRYGRCLPCARWCCS